MKVTASDHFTVNHASELYGLSAWGNGYLSIGENGHLTVRPARAGSQAIDVHEVICRLADQGIDTPVLLRFPQLLKAQVNELVGSFERAVREFNYSGRFLPVYPVKVNQQHSVVEDLLRSGREHALGLEVGSGPELMAAAAQDLPPEALIVCNGFKDTAYLSSAALASRLGKRVVVVVEKPFELDSILDLPRDAGMPMIGFRIRLQARGSGLWEKSGGFASKFGLSTRQLLDALDRLRSAGLQERVSLLHFHVGSQITEIRKVKNAVHEGSRIYAKLRKLGVPLRYLDVGGGLGVDYDGSKTSSDASVNYTVQEYANDVVFGIREVCAEEKVELPDIVSESGRMLVAYHSMLVTNVQASLNGVDAGPGVPSKGTPVVENLEDIERTINVKNFREFYHDALAYRDQLYSRFNLGLLSLDDRASGESLFYRIAGKAVRYSKSAKFVAEEFLELESKLHHKYICNFSVFQSLPDHWALDQLFPVMPIHRLDERPTCRARLADITCDSDGEVEKFVAPTDIKDALEVHELRPGEKYYLAFALVGAYQDTMGDLHNLFGRVHQARVSLDPENGTVIESVRRGEQGVETLCQFGYCEDQLVSNIEGALSGRVREGRLGPEEAARWLENYKLRLRGYTYLDP